MGGSLCLLEISVFIHVGLSTSLIKHRAKLHLKKRKGLFVVAEVYAQSKVMILLCFKSGPVHFQRIKVWFTMSPVNVLGKHQLLALAVHLSTLVGGFR